MTWNSLALGSHDQTRWADCWWISSCGPIVIDFLLCCNPCSGWASSVDPWLRVGSWITYKEVEFRVCVLSHPHHSLNQHLDEEVGVKEDKVRDTYYMKVVETLIWSLLEHVGILWTFTSMVVDVVSSLYKVYLRGRPKRFERWLGGQP